MFLLIQIFHVTSVLNGVGIFWGLWYKTGRVFGLVIRQRHAARICCISLPQGTVHVVKRIRSNDRVLVYINTASSRQEGSLTGPWCPYYACSLASDHQISVLAGRIWCVSIPYTEFFQDRCIQSNNWVPDYNQSASNRHIWSITRPRCSFHAAYHDFAICS